MQSHSIDGLQYYCLTDTYFLTTHSWTTINGFITSMTRRKTMIPKELMHRAVASTIRQGIHLSFLSQYIQIITPDNRDTVTQDPVQIDLFFRGHFPTACIPPPRPTNILPS